MPLNLAWATGFFEGEGYIGIVRHGRHGRFTLSVSVRQCEIEPLLLFKERFGGCVVVHRPASGNVRLSHAWTLQRNPAAIFLSAIRPFVVRQVIRKRIDVAVRFDAIVQEYKARKLGVKCPEYDRLLFGVWEEMNALKTRGINGEANQNTMG